MRGSKRLTEKKAPEKNKIRGKIASDNRPIDEMNTVVVENKKNIVNKLKSMKKRKMR